MVHSQKKWKSIIAWTNLKTRYEHYLQNVDWRSKKKNIWRARKKTGKVSKKITTLFHSGLIIRNLWNNVPFLWHLILNGWLFCYNEMKSLLFVYCTQLILIVYYVPKSGIVYAVIFCMLFHALIAYQLPSFLWSMSCLVFL